MTSKQALITEGDGLLDLKALIDVYEEIAANQMQKVRKSVLGSREFMDGVTKIFIQVRASYDKEIAKLERAGRRVDEFSVLPRNGKTAAVFVSANSGLFGDIVERTFAEFVTFIKANKVDPVIVGRLGLRMVSDRRINILYNYFDFPDDHVDFDSVDLIMRYLLQYEKIIVFHGQFRSLVYQEVVSTGVSGHDLIAQHEATDTQKTAYIFEPTLRDVLQLFEGQILSGIFTQALHESQLAKFASRMFNLDHAMDNIDKRLSILADRRRLLEHQIIARKQLNRLAGMTIWAK